MLIATMSVMSGITIVATLPLISQHFNNIENIDFYSKLMLTVPSIVIALSAPISGIFIDKFGRLKPLYTGMVLFIIGGSSGFYIDDFWTILIGRAVMGVGVALLMTSAMSLTGDYFNDDERHKYMSLQGMAIGIGGIIFISSGGFLAQIHWSYPFAIYLVPLLFFPLLIPTLFEPKIELRERSTEDEVEAKLWPIYFSALFVMLLFYMLPTQLPYLIINTLQGTASNIGLIIAFSMFINALTSMQYARLKKHLSYPSIFALAFGAFSIGLFLISRVNEVHELYYSVIFIGMGFGLMLVNINSWFLSVVEPHRRGRASGLLASSFFIGQFLSPLLFQPVIKLYGIQGLFFAVSCLTLLITIFLLLSIIKKNNIKKNNIKIF